MHCATQSTVSNKSEEPRSEAQAVAESPQPYEQGANLNVAPPPPPSTHEPAPPGALQANLVVSRSRGVAPLIVHFDASDSVGDPRPFHSLKYRFQFGDPNAGRWAHTGHDKNTATGPIAAHVFEKPGTYRVRLTVENAAKKRHHIEVPITVDDPNVVFRTNTICFANGSDFKDCPEGAEHITTNRWSVVAQHTARPARLLLKRGDKWSGDATLVVERPGESILGAFGKCVAPDERGICKNAPEIYSDCKEQMLIIASGDQRVMDISLTGKTGDNGQWAIGCGGVGVLIYRVRTFQFQGGVQSSFLGTDQDQLAMVDSDIGHATSNQAYVGAERLMLLGNHIHDSVTSHVLRVWHAYKSVISENLIENATVGGPNGRHALKLHGFDEKELSTGKNAQGGPLHRTEWLVISDNTFGASPPWPVSIGPQHNQGDERVSNIIFERNFFRTSGRVFKTAQPLDTPLHCAALGDITVRSNVFDATGAGEDFSAMDISRYPLSPPTVDNVHFEDNLIFRTDRKGRSLRMVHVSKDSHGTRVTNNVGYAPQYEASGRVTVEDEGVGTISEKNEYVNELKLSEKDVWSSRWLSGHEDTAQLAQGR